MLKVTEIRKTGEVIYALVTPPDEIVHWMRKQGAEIPPWHITIATAPGVQPKVAKEAAEKRSGELLQGMELPLTLPFKTGAFTGKDIIYKS